MTSKKTSIISLGNLHWQIGDTLKWTSTGFLFNGKPLKESGRLKEGIYADSGLGESAEYQDAINKARYQESDQNVKQECKHEAMAKFFVQPRGVLVGPCIECGCYLESRNGEWVKMFPVDVQLKPIKPSEQIKKHAKELCIKATGYVTNWKEYLNKATRDFLDEHSNVFNR